MHRSDDPGDIGHSSPFRSRRILESRAKSSCPDIRRHSSGSGTNTESFAIAIQHPPRADLWNTADGSVLLRDERFPLSLSSSHSLSLSLFVSPSSSLYLSRSPSRSLPLPPSLSKRPTPTRVCAWKKEEEEEEELQHPPAYVSLGNNRHGPNAPHQAIGWIL